jgi:hypothetical protein
MKNIKFALALTVLVQFVGAATVVAEGRMCSIYDIDYTSGERSQMIVSDDMAMLDNMRIGNGKMRFGSYKGVKMEEEGLSIKHGYSKEGIYETLRRAFGDGIVDITDETVECDEIDVMHEHYAQQRRAGDL